MSGPRKRWLGFGLRNLRRDIEEEVDHHLEQRTRELMEQGLDPQAARAEARRRFGERAQIAEEVHGIDRGAVRERRAVAWLQETSGDVVLGARRLVNNPAFSLVAVVTMTLGLAASIAVFSVLNTLILRPLPYPDADRLVEVWESNPSASWPQFSMSQPNFVDYRDGNESFATFAAVEWTTFNLTGVDEPRRLEGNWVSHDFFTTLGLPMTLGRPFTRDEDAPGDKQRVAVLSHELWQSAFGADPAVLGREISLNEAVYTVVGVAPENNGPLPAPGVYAPLNASLDVSRSDHRLSVIGRLAPGVGIEQAEADLDAIAGRLQSQYPESNTGFDTVVLSLHRALVGDSTRSSLYTVVGAVAFVLLIACANLANLLLARAAGRHREMALYMALGASRGRVARQMLTESGLVTLIGGGLGLATAVWILGLFRTLGAGQIPRFSDLRVDPTVVAFALGLSLISGLLSGLVPALQVSGRDLHRSLSEGGRSGTADIRSARSRKMLLVAEVALSVVLVAGAGLLIRSFQRVQDVDPGFEADNVLALAISVPAARHPDEGGVASFYRQLLTELEAIPGVKRAAAVSALPFGPGATSMDFFVEGAKRDPDGSTPSAYWRLVTPGYFEALGIPLVQGQLFDDGEELTGVVISRHMAENHWPDGGPLGKRFLPWRDEERMFTVIGVVEDVRERSYETAPVNVVYIPFYPAAGAWEYMFLTLSTSVPPESVAGSVRAVVHELDPDQPIADVRPLAALLDDSLSQRRFGTLLLSSFAVLALGLAAAGIYGVMSYSVARRGAEFGVRMAMGARPYEVLRLVLGQGFRLALLGVGIGAAASLGLTRLMRSLLYEVAPADPVSLLAAALFLGATAVLACLLPAWRATRVDPVAALRES